MRDLVPLLVIAIGGFVLYSVAFKERGDSRPSIAGDVTTFSSQDTGEPSKDNGLVAQVSTLFGLDNRI